MSVIQPSIVNWYGGKFSLARQIVSVMPDHNQYVEVFMGSAAVFFNKPKATLNVLNDLNSNLVNLFIQTRDNFDELAEKIYWTLYSRDQYNIFKKKLNDGSIYKLSDIDRAVAYYCIVRASFSGGVEFGFKPTGHTWRLSLIDKLRLAREKLDMVMIENLTFDELIKKYMSKPDVLLYLDPPYWVTIKETSYYELAKTSFKEVHHYNLFQLLSSTECKCNWIMSYDDVPEVVNLYKGYPVQRLSAKYSPGVLGQEKICSELLISNFKMKRPQINLFDENGAVFEDIEEEEFDSAHHAIKLKVEREKEEFERQIKEQNAKPIIRTKPTEEPDLFA